MRLVHRQCGATLALGHSHCDSQAPLYYSAGVSNEGPIGVGPLPGAASACAGVATTNSLTLYFRALEALPVVEPSAGVDPQPSIYDGFRNAVVSAGGLADTRFTCRRDSEDTYAVDVVFGDVDWYLRATRPTSPSMVLPPSARAPRRANLLSGDEEAVCTEFDIPLSPQDTTGDSTFAVGFSGAAETQWGRGPSSTCGGATNLDGRTDYSVRCSCCCT